MKSIVPYLLSVCLLDLSARAASVTASPAPPGPPAAPEAAQPAAAVTLPDPVAVVEGDKIGRDELDNTLSKLLASRGRSVDALDPQQKLQGYRAVLDQMILQRLVKKRSAGVKVTDQEIDLGFSRIKARFPTEAEMNVQMQKSGETVQSIKDGIRSAIQQKKWIDSQIGDKGAVTEAEAQNYYDKNPAKFQMPEQVRASHILFAAPKDATPEVLAAKEKLARDILERIQKGEDFDKLAKEFSDDPGSKGSGGDLNFFSRAQMVPEFSDAAFRLKKGEVGGPVKTQFGYHIIKVTDRKGARTMPFVEVKERLVAFLGDQKRQNAVQTLLAQIREKADVKNYLAAPAPNGLRTP